MNHTDFVYLGNVYQDLTKNCSIKNLSQILAFMPQERTDLAEIITTIIFQDALKLEQKNKTSSKTMSTQIKSSANELIDIFSEQNKDFPEPEMLNLEYLKNNHKIFINPNLTSQDWNYLTIVKKNFIKDSS